jgi:predicted DNA binding CopG/RHH family protein
MNTPKTVVENANGQPINTSTNAANDLNQPIDGQAGQVVQEARAETAATNVAQTPSSTGGVRGDTPIGAPNLDGQTPGAANSPVVIASAAIVAPPADNQAAIDVAQTPSGTGSVQGGNPIGTPASDAQQKTGEVHETGSKLDNPDALAAAASVKAIDNNSGDGATGHSNAQHQGVDESPAQKTEPKTDIFTEPVKDDPTTPNKPPVDPRKPTLEKAPEAFVSKAEGPKDPPPPPSPPAPPSRTDQPEPRREPPQQTAPQPSQAQPPQEKQLPPPVDATRPTEPAKPQPEARPEPRQAPTESPVTPPQQQSSPTPPSTPTASPITPEKPQVTERAPEPSQSAKQPPAPEPRQAPTQPNTSPAEAPAPVAKQPEVRAIEKNLTLESIRERLTQQKQLETQDNREPKAREVRREEARPIEEKPKSADVKAVEIQRKIAEIVTVSQSSDAQGTKNFIEAAKTMNKLELVKAVTEAIAVALKDGNVSKVADVVKAALTDGNVRQAIRMVIQKTTGDAAPVVRRPQSSSDGSKPKLPLDQAKAIDAITQPITSKQEAMKVLLGLVVDASKLQNPVVQAVQAETASKIQTIQSSIDELLKLRVEQFMALSTKAHGVDGATLNKICHEAIQELATRHGLTDEQRAMLSRVMVQLHENDFARDLDAPKKTPDQLDGEKASQKDVKPPEAKVLSKQELEKLFREELVQLEEFLKERDEVKLKRAQEKLEALLEEASEEGMEYVIDEDYEVIKTFTLRGVVRHEKTKEPIPFAHIYAGILGTLITDGDGLFTFLNVPQDTAYMIGVDKIGMKFAPEFVTGSMTTSVDIAFLGEELI